MARPDPPLAREVVARLPAYRPGRSAADAMATHGIEGAVKLASNELAFGPLPAVVDAIAEAATDVRRYPAHGAPSLRAAIADHLGRPVTEIAVGNGSVGLLQQLCLAFVDPGDRVVFGALSFEAYPVFTSLAGGEGIAVPNVDDALDADAIAVAAATFDRLRLVLVANPNNPTSTAIDGGALVRIADATPDDALLVVDEAYREFVTDTDVPDALDLLAGRSNVAVLRTFSKAHGLAGLRVGHLVGPAPVVDAVDRVLVPFAVNAVAEVAAITSLGFVDEVARRCQRTVAERARVADGLRGLGCDVPWSEANFVWLPTAERSGALGEGLERGGVVTRVFPGAGIRVTIGTPSENDRFLAVFDAVRADGVPA